MDTKTTQFPTKPLNFYHDSGHGWLEVPEALYKAAGITATRFSYYSAKNKMIYLEEDLDAPAFINAMEICGIEVKSICTDHGTLSPIRKLSRMP